MLETVARARSALQNSTKLRRSDHFWKMRSVPPVARARFGIKILKIHKNTLFSE